MRKEQKDGGKNGIILLRLLRLLKHLRYKTTYLAIVNTVLVETERWIGGDRLPNSLIFFIMVITTIIMIMIMIVIIMIIKMDKIDRLPQEESVVTGPVLLKPNSTVDL